MNHENPKPPKPPVGADTGGLNPPTPQQTDAVHPRRSAEPPHIPGYRLIRPLGRGGQGEVYEAFQEATGGRVAIKFLPTRMYQSPDAKRNLTQEIRLLVQLRHPNIVSVYDAGETSDGYLYCILEHLHGLPLRDYVRQHKLGLPAVLRLFRVICEAVHFVSRHGVVHRDLKPANILVDDQGVPKILDFGLARVLCAPEDFSEGQIVGTLPYMAPEQTSAGNVEIDARTDVYSLGVILYELLVGQYPYPVTGALDDIFHRICETPPGKPRTAWLPGQGMAPLGPGSGCPIDWELEAILLHALQKEKPKRYSDAGELAANLGAYLQLKPVQPLSQKSTYLLFTLLRGWTLRHPTLALVVVALAAHFTAITAAWPLYPGSLTALESAFDAITPSWAADFEYVRVIGIMPSTDIDALAREARIEGYTKENKGIRALHGKLLERLALSGCAAVAWDFMFPGESEFDAEFVRGVQRIAGADVLVADFNGCWLGPGEGPLISSEIAQHIRGVGIAFADFTNELPWSVPLVVRRGKGKPIAALSLLAAASYLEPGELPEIDWDAEGLTVTLKFWKADPLHPQAPAQLKREHRIQLTRHRTTRESDLEAKEFGLLPGDEVGYLEVEIPGDKTLEAHTHSYESVFKADPSQLREWFEGKVVVMGNLRCPPVGNCDRFAHPDGRKDIWGCYGHAAAAEAVLRGRARTLPSEAANILLTAGAALTGCGIAHRVAYRSGRRRLILGGVSTLLILGSALIFWRTQLLWNPLVAILAFWLAAEAFAAMVRATVRRRGWD